MRGFRWPDGTRQFRRPVAFVPERVVRPRTIAGVGTRTAGFLGETERGPTSPRVLTGVEEYTRHYGGSTAESYVAEAVAGFFENGGDRCHVARVTAAAAVASATLADDGTPVVGVSALGPGAWGNRVAVTVGDAPGDLPDHFELVVQYWSADGAATPDGRSGDPAVEEVYDAVSVAPGAPVQFETAVNGTSALVTVERLATGRPENGTTALEGGDDAAPPDLAAYRGSSGGTPSGLAALEAVDEIAVVCAPDDARVAGLAAALVEHCERTGDRVAVLDAPRQAGPPADLHPPVESANAAFYYPWIRVSAPETATGERLVPPSGHVAGLYARVDAEQGVHKAPADEVLRGATGLQVDVGSAEQGVLTPRGVNCIRAFPGRGIRVWGARTTAPDSEWRYVNVRRLLLSLEESIDEGTRWVAFEENAEPTWDRVRESVEGFLYSYWQAGALAGRTPEEAYSVRCDRSTMTQRDLEEHRLVLEVAVAPVKPAEFLVFRVEQTTA